MSSVEQTSHCVKSAQIRSNFRSVFSAFGLNTKSIFRIHSECGKIRTRNYSVFGHFSRSEYQRNKSETSTCDIISSASDKSNLIETFLDVITVHVQVFVPSQEIEYLGFIINPVTMTVRLTTEKKRKIVDLCQEVLLKESVSIRLVSKLLGKFTSSFQAIKYGQLHYHDLECLKTKALKINKGNFDKKISIDSLGNQDIIWRKSNILRVIQYYKNWKPLLYNHHWRINNTLESCFQKYFDRWPI